MTKKTLKEVLPPEFMSCEYQDTRARKFANVEVVEEVDGCEKGRGWPGPQKNVFWWYRLANGMAVGFNENPARGWSFPMITNVPKSVLPEKVFLDEIVSMDEVSIAYAEQAQQISTKERAMELVNEITSKGPFVKLFDLLDEGESHDLCQHLEEALTPIVAENQNLKQQVQRMKEFADALRVDGGVGLFIAQEIENRLAGGKKNG